MVDPCNINGEPLSGGRNFWWEMENCQAIVESHGNSESHHIDTDQPIEFKVKSDPLPFYGAENSRERNQVKYVA